MSDDGTLKDDHDLAKCFKLLDEASIKHGRAYHAIDKFKETMIEAGFVNVVESRFLWPTNAWPKDKKHKELGIWNNENMSIALESLTMAAFTRAHGWTRDEDFVGVPPRRAVSNTSAGHHRIDGTICRHLSRLRGKDGWAGGLARPSVGHLQGTRPRRPQSPCLLRPGNLWRPPPGNAGTPRGNTVECPRLPPDRNKIP
ncbi:hypothetical protein AUP68_17594 [Ilyonectria robusta]